MNRLAARGALLGAVLHCAAGGVFAQESGPASAPVEPTVHDLRTKILAVDQVLLEYRFDDSRGAVHLVSQDRERTVPIPVGRDSVLSLLDSLRVQLHTGHAAPPAAVRLHALLVDPVAGDLPPGARLVLVPGGTLRDLPFAALGGPDAFLAHHHALSTIPSVASIAGPPGKRMPRPRAAVRLAPAAADSFLAANGAALHVLDVVPAAAHDSLLADLARGLEAGLPPDVALQRAQLAAIARGDPPGAWGPYVVTGRMSAPRSTGTFPAWLLPVGLALGVVALGLALRITAPSPPRHEPE